MPETIAGLPLHVLVIHVVVVLVPLVGLGTVAMAIWRSFSRRYGVVVAGLSWPALGASLVARQSGLALADEIGTPQPHAELGSVLPWFVLGLAATSTALWLVDRGIPANKARPWWVVVLAVVAVVAAILATWWTIRVGDSGARAVWEPVVRSSSP